MQPPFLVGTTKPEPLFLSVTAKFDIGAIPHHIYNILRHSHTKNLYLLFIVSSILQQSKISTRGLIVNVKTILNRSNETTTDI
jgi:hypothetical protein